MCRNPIVIAFSKHQNLPKPSARGQSWYLDFIVLILSALCLLDLLGCFTTRYTVDSHFQGHKKTELVMIHPLYCSELTRRRFHPLSSSDAMPYSLQAYCSCQMVSHSFLFPSPLRVMYIWYQVKLIFFLIGRLFAVLWRCLSCVKMVKLPLEVGGCR